MQDIQKYAFGTERHFQGSGCAKMVGDEAVRIGKRALIVAGEKAWKAAGDVVTESLTRSDVEFELHPFAGYCSERNVQAIMDHIKTSGCDLVIGVGGGKCMDATKSASDKRDKPYILVPTSAATCAANVRGCVWYTDEGVCHTGMRARKSPETLLVDTEIIGKAPARLLASGMADALAKFPELDYSRRMLTNEHRTGTLESAVAIARNSIELLLLHGPLAMLEVSSGQPGIHTERVVEVSICITGLTSNLVAGIHQLQVAHMFHDAVCSLYHDSRTKYLHGEMVAVGIMLQLASNQYDMQLIDRIRQFLLEIKVPTCMSDLEIEPTTENRDILYHYIVSHGFDQPDMKEVIYRAFQTILK